MKSIIIFKNCESSDLAHLYEHLFFDALVDFFDNKDCIMRLDYSLRGKTYEPGLLHFDISLYTQPAIDAAQQIGSVSIPTDDPSVSVALLQLMAEHGKELRGNEKLFEALKELDKKEWENLETLETLDLNEQDERSSPVELTDNRLATKTLSCELSANTGLSQNLLPLFEVVSNVVLTAMQNALASTYGYYPPGSPFKYDKAERACVALLHASSQHRPELTEELGTCKEAFNQLIKASMPAKIVAELASPGSDQSPAIVDELEIYNSTKTLIGRAGWKKLATKENIEQILQTSTLKLKYGTNRRSTRLF